MKTNKIYSGTQGCKVHGCDRKHKGRGYCSEHLAQIRRNGKITRQKIGCFERSTCIVEGCFEPVKALGYCSRHCYQFYTHGRIISAGNLRNRDRKCTVEGCDRKHKANGFCEAHNRQFKKHGKIITEIVADRNGISKSGEYILILKPDHPEANKKGYVLRSHIVWEKHTGHIVVPPEVIHHRNGIKDCDEFENLRLFASDAEHQKTVHRKKGVFGVIRGGIIK